MKTTTLNNRTGEPKTVKWADPIWCKLTNRRVRFSRVEADGMVEVMENDGLTICPDLRHPTQLVAYAS